MTISIKTVESKIEQWNLLKNFFESSSGSKEQKIAKNFTDLNFALLKLIKFIVS